MSRFVDDPGDIRGDRPPRPPVMLSDLLAELDVVDADDAEQRSAIEHWLERNEPVPFLALHLSDLGYTVTA